MITFLISLALKDTFGDKIYIVSSQQHVDLIPENSSFFFQATENLFLKFKGNKDIPPRKTSVISNQFIQISNSTSQVKTKSEDISYFVTWHVPLSICPPGSVAFSADHVINFETETDSVRRDFCIFPQSDVLAHTIEGKFSTPSETCVLELYPGKLESHVIVANSHHSSFHRFRIAHLKKEAEYRNISGLSVPVLVVKPNMTFHMSFYTPFFMRFSGCNGYPLKTSFEATVKRDETKSADCSVDSVPVLSTTGGMKMENPLGYVNIVKCENTAKNTTFTLFLASGSLLFFSVILIVLFFLPRRSSLFSVFGLRVTHTLHHTSVY